MLGANKQARFSLKAMINRDETKVLFVEADNHFVDVLLSFLTMPLGKIVRLLSKHYGDKAPAIGSLTSLYKGLQNLGSFHFWKKGGKKMLVNPRNSSEAECRKLKLNIDDEPTNYLICEACSLLTDVTMYGCDLCRDCRGETYVELPLIEPQSNATEVFTKTTASFIIFDDLRIVPNSIGFEHCLTSIGITEMEGAKLRDVSFGFNEIMDLLKGSLLSRTPLSDIILKNRTSTAAKPESQMLCAPFLDKPISKSKKMTLKVMVQKSTSKVLFGQAEEDLVDLLFSFLAIPLGGVASLLQGNTSITNIDNLYKDVAHSIPEKYLIKPDMKNRLIKPKLGVHYLSGNQILPLEEETHPLLYYHRAADGKGYLSSDHYSTGSVLLSLESPKGHTNYVKGPTTYMVTDDLVITQFSVASSFSIIQRLNIPMSDVNQMDFIIGVPEALRILKVSLTSDSALTDALLTPMKKKDRSKASALIP